MKALKSISLAVGLVLAVGAVGVAAHSQNQTKPDNVMRFKGGGWLLPVCNLIVERTGGQFVYRVPSDSRAHFIGYWPVQPGVVSLTYGVSNPNVQNAVDTSEESSTVTESLDVQFEKVNGELVPVNYTYHNWVAGRASSLLANPPSCPVSPLN